MWLLNSAGVQYDPWIVQGCIDFFGNLQIRRGEVYATREIETYLKRLDKNTKLVSPRTLQLGKAPGEPAYDWAVLHYLLIAREGWKGTPPLLEYQQLVNRGSEREAAFARVFGVSRLEVDPRVAEFIKRGKVAETRLGVVAGGTLPTVAWHELADGVQDCLLAQFMLQQLGADKERALARINRAAAKIPNDVRLQEAWWFYYSSIHESGSAREALARAVRSGTHNHFLRAQWCIDVINDQMLRGSGFLCDEATAVEAADMLGEMIGDNPQSASNWKMLAEFVPSITPARDADRVLLESGQIRLPGNPLILTGLAAWYWRHGDFAEARRRLGVIQPDESTAPIAMAYAKWLAHQVEATAVLTAVKSAMAAGDYEEAARRLGEFPPGPLGNLTLQREVQELRREFDLQDMLRLAEEHLAHHRRMEAETLLESAMDAGLPDSLKARAEALKAKLAGISGPK